MKAFLRGVENSAPPERQTAAMMPGVISAIRATAIIPRRGRGGRMETRQTAEARGRVDVTLALTLRDGGLRVSEAAALAWGDVERWPDGSGRLTIVRSKTDQEGEGDSVAITPACLQALDAIRPDNAGDEGRSSGFPSARWSTGSRRPAMPRASRATPSPATAGVGLARMMSGAGAPTETTCGRDGESRR